MWRSGNILLNFSFKIQYISTDGAQTNRALFKVLLAEFKSINPKTCSFRNLYIPEEEVVFTMDFSHVVKKVKNNISKSGKEAHCKRHLKLADQFIEWKHFTSAYLWDISSHPFPIHHKLSQEHLFLTSEAKMRNHLAEEVLNADKLHIIGMYQRVLVEQELK